MNEQEHVFCGLCLKALKGHVRMGRNYVTYEFVINYFQLYYDASMFFFCFSYLCFDLCTRLTLWFA